MFSRIYVAANAMRLLGHEWIDIPVFKDSSNIWVGTHRQPVI
jgi:hypothetical protein